MKKNIFIFACATALFFFACSSNGGKENDKSNVEKNDSGKFAQIKFDTAVYNFGTIMQGEQVSYNFNFTNIGNSDLIIDKLETSCGCTVPEYDKKPVPAGKRGFVRVRFDSDGKSGNMYKTVKISTNGKDPIYELVITGKVKE